jgi:drug/metabolite transporter (DMT)-like permease
MYFLATPAALLFLTERDRGPAEPGAGRSRGASQMTSNDHGGRAPALLQVGAVPLRPIAALVSVALIWGVAFLVVKQMVAQIPPAVLVAWRFSLAAVVVVVCNPRCLRGVTLRALVRSMILGGVLGTGFLLQTWGFETTSVVVGAFITGSVVLLAPVVARVWLGRRFAIRTGSAVALATAGLAMISLRGAHLGLGEALTLGAAALWALHLVALGAWVRADEVYASAVIQLVVVALLAWSVAAVTPGGIDAPSTPSVWLAVIVLGAIATGAAAAHLGAGAGGFDHLRGGADARTGLRRRGRSGPGWGAVHAGHRTRRRRGRGGRTDGGSRRIDDRTAACPQRLASAPRPRRSVRRCPTGTAADIPAGGRPSMRRIRPRP